MSKTDIGKKTLQEHKTLVNASPYSEYLWYYHMIGRPLLEVLRQKFPHASVVDLSKHRVSFYRSQQDNVADSWVKICCAQLVRPSVFAICIKKYVSTNNRLYCIAH